MDMLHLTRLETEITQLAQDEQLWLIERLAYRLQREGPRHAEDQSQLEAMAADPQIIRELRAIDREFAVAEADGLGDL